MEPNENPIFSKYGFEELKFYIMSSINELKEKMDNIEKELIGWRQQSLVDITELKTKIGVASSVIALTISLIVSIVISVVIK